MPKKKWGDNPKALEARTRKDNKKREEQERVEKAKDDAFWADDDKHLKRKQQRKADKESKKHELVEKKLEKQRLLEEEMAQLKGPTVKTAGGGKMTQAQIQAQLEREKQQAQQKAKRPEQEEAPLEENVNKLIADQLAAEGAVEARSVEEAISVLSVKEAAVDRHPERRMKAAYNKYEEENLPRLKQENPNMRLSQLKQMLKKDWMKSPENPMNQRNLAFNAKS
ncbi:coiled-coil domain-containing protein 124-like [Branchiostoma lanceolatum]|uniref:coiled-coil domain-containing protein 124-like n=1 Tax=Branchiostoma lanceolatum TaxID=7740 RepID=UPI003453198F